MSSFHAVCRKFYLFADLETLTLTYCSHIVLESSFGDESTPLHKAAAGGRYLAVHMILEALKDRDSILQNESTLMKPNSSWLQRGLSARDKSGRTPLDVAQHFFRVQDTERDAVARCQCPISI